MNLSWIINSHNLIIVGTIGHVAHGKSTVVKAISGVQTVRFKNELIRNITIKLGYANAKVQLSASNSSKLFSLFTTNSDMSSKIPLINVVATVGGRSRAGLPRTNKFHPSL